MIQFKILISNFEQRLKMHPFFFTFHVPSFLMHQGINKKIV